MPKKIKLNLEELKVESFKTSNEEQVQGGKSVILLTITIGVTIASITMCSELDIVCDQPA